MKKKELSDREKLNNIIKSNRKELEEIIKNIKYKEIIKYQCNGLNIFVKYGDGIDIKFEEEKDKYKVITDVSRFSRIISFYPERDDNSYEEIIFKASDIMYYINKYQMTHAIYTDEDINENISIKSEDCLRILENPKITKIIDDHLIKDISEEKFNKSRLNYFDNCFFATHIYKYSKVRYHKINCSK